MNATKCLEYEQSCILNEVLEASDKEEVIDKYLQHMQSMSHATVAVIDEYLQHMQSMSHVTAAYTLHVSACKSWYIMITSQSAWQHASRTPTTPIKQQQWLYTDMVKWGLTSHSTHYRSFWYNLKRCANVNIFASASLRPRPSKFQDL